LALALTVAAATPVWAVSLSVLKSDGSEAGIDTEVGGLCLLRLLPDHGEEIVSPAVTAGRLRLVRVEDAVTPMFWLPCDSLGPAVELHASWSSQDGQRGEMRRMLAVRNVELRLRVEILPQLGADRTLYATGSLYGLGMLPDGTWQPRARPMTPLGGGHWFARILAGPGDRCSVEFTLGGWGTKGRNAAGSVIKLTRPLASHVEIAALVRNFGLRTGAPGTIAPHLSLSTASGDHMVLAFRDERGSGDAMVGPSPENLGSRRAKKAAGGWYVDIPNLSPAEERYYALWDGAETHGVRVPGSQEMTFCVLGDVQDHRGVVEAMAARESPHLVLQAGDLVNAGWDEREWTQNMETITSVASRAPYMAVPGNHEEESPIFREVFHFPHVEFYYAFAYGPARFLMLDSEAPYEPGTPQRAFAESVLTAWSTTDGPIFVCLHAPPFSNGRHGSDHAVRRELCPLFERAGVWVVFSGHDHGYEATWPLRDGLVREDGTVYVVTGGGGARLYESRPDSPVWSRGRQVRHHWCVVRVAPNRVEVTAVTPEGETIDRFVVRPPHRG